MSWPPLEAGTLDCGLRVVLLDVPGSPAVTVCGHSPAGSRADPPGAAGLAHLTEHVLALAPDGSSTVSRLEGAGGASSATTHLDHLDAVHTAPAQMLDDLLQVEASRLAGEPRSDAAAFERQRAGVLREIESHQTSARAGSDGWPLIAPHLFSSWPDRHDPYGDVDDVTGLRTEDCLAYAHTHVRPDNSILTVAGDLASLGGAAAVLDRAHTALARTATVPPPRHLPVPPPEPAPAEPFWRGVTITTDRGSAIGWTVPAPDTDPVAYRAALLVAEALSLPFDGPGSARGSAPNEGPAPWRVRLGRTAVADCRGVDALGAWNLSGPALHHWLPLLERRLEDIALGRAGQLLGRASERLVLARLHAGTSVLARQAGASTFLFGDPAGGLPPARHAASFADEAAAVAARLLEAPRPLVYDALPAAVAGRTHQQASHHPPLPAGRAPRERPADRGRSTGATPRLASVHGSELAGGQRVTAIERAGSGTWVSCRFLLPAASPLIVNTAAPRIWAGLVRRWSTQAGDLRISLLLPFPSPVAQLWSALTSAVATDHGQESALVELAAVGPQATDLVGEVVHGAPASARTPGAGSATGTRLVTGGNQRDVQVLIPLEARPSLVPARWLALALLHDVAGLAAGRPPGLLDPPAWGFAAQDARGTRPHLVVRATSPAAGLTQALITSLSPVRLQQRVAMLPATTAFCAAQWAVAAHDPATLADLASRLSAVGGAADLVADFPHQLRTVTPEVILQQWERDLDTTRLADALDVPGTATAPARRPHEGDPSHPVGSAVPSQ